MKAIDEKKIKLHRTIKVEIKDIVQLLVIIEHRNRYIENKLNFYTDGMTAGENIFFK